MSSRAWFALPALAIVTLLVVPARAQSSQEQAREHFNRGLALVDAQRFEEAAMEFGSAYELRPHPLVLYNLGLVQVAARQLVRAVASFEAYLGLPDHDEGRAAEVRERIAGLVAKLAYVELLRLMAARRSRARAEARCGATGRHLGATTVRQ